jgi:hypothetical protein
MHLRRTGVVFATARDNRFVEKVEALSVCGRKPGAAIRYFLGGTLLMSSLLGRNETAVPSVCAVLPFAEACIPLSGHVVLDKDVIVTTAE